MSKVYHLIDRMSEDIDLAIDRSFFGLTGDLTKRQTKKLRKQSSLFVRDEFASQLEDRLKEYGLEQYLTVEPEPDGEGDNTYPEPRKIHIRYNALFGKPSYLNPEVMLEIGSRSLFEPTEIAQQRPKKRSLKKHFCFTRCSQRKGHMSQTENHVTCMTLRK